MVVVFCPQLVAKQALNEVSLTLWYHALVHFQVKADCRSAFLREDGFEGQNYCSLSCWWPSGKAIAQWK